MGMVAMNVMCSLWHFSQKSLHDHLLLAFAINLPCLTCGCVAFLQSEKLSIRQVRLHQSIITVGLTVMQLGASIFQGLTSDLEGPVICVIALILVHITFSSTTRQKICMFTIVLLNLAFSLVGLSHVASSKSDYSRVYSYGHCMDSMNCRDENFDPMSLSLVCDPAEPAILLSKESLNFTRTDIGKSATEWFRNAHPNCDFVLRKSSWPHKQIFFLACFLLLMIQVIIDQNKVGCCVCLPAC